MGGRGATLTVTRSIAGDAWADEGEKKSRGQKKNCEEDKVDSL